VPANRGIFQFKKDLDKLKLLIGYPHDSIRLDKSCFSLPGELLKRLKCSDNGYKKCFRKRDNGSIESLRTLVLLRLFEDYLVFPVKWMGEQDLRIHSSIGILQLKDYNIATLSPFLDNDLFQLISNIPAG
jgi:hypothetical protein